MTPPEGPQAEQQSPLDRYGTEPASPEQLQQWAQSGLDKEVERPEDIQFVSIERAEDGTLQRAEVDVRTFLNEIQLLLTPEAEDARQRAVSFFNTTNTTDKHVISRVQALLSLGYPLSGVELCLFRPREVDPDDPAAEPTIKSPVRRIHPLERARIITAARIFSLIPSWQRYMSMENPQDTKKYMRISLGKLVTGEMDTYRVGNSGARQLGYVNDEHLQRVESLNMYTGLSSEKPNPAGKVSPEELNVILNNVVTTFKGIHERVTSNLQ